MTNQPIGKSAQQYISTSVYNFFLVLYRLGAYILSVWKPKAKQWLSGQQQVKKQLRSLTIISKTIWVHCASLGEYEQARPIIDRLKRDSPEYHLVLTFFSPSGYEIVNKKEKDATVLYLPFDSVNNSTLFLNVIHPSLAIFVKYEHWHYYLYALKQKGIPALSVSAIFRPGQMFFKWYGSFFRNMLKQYAYILVQDEKSLALLKDIGITNASVSGDTRFDRVLAIKTAAGTLPVIEKFAQNSKLIIAGSTWPKDEELLAQYINEQTTNNPEVKFLIAPHEVSPKHIQQLTSKLRLSSYTLYSSAEIDNNARVMIVDTIGVLSRCYQYGYLAYIGGGFGAGIHNTLEAAVYGIPLIFGPKYGKFKEARDLVTISAAFAVNDYKELENKLNNFLKDQSATAQAGKAAEEYVLKNTGATEKVMEKIDAVSKSWPY